MMGEYECTRYAYTYGIPGDLHIMHDCLRK